MSAMRSSLLGLGVLSLFAAACGSAPVDSTDSALVMQNDPPATNAPAGGGENAPPPKQTVPVPPPPDATPTPNPAPTGCNLPHAYAATLADPVINKGGVSYGPGGPSSGLYFRATTTSDANPMGPSENRLFLEKGDVIGGPSNEIVPTGYRALGGCTWSSNLVSCSANEYFQLFGNEKAGNDFRIVSLTQTHNPKFGYGGFALEQIDPKTGATSRFGRYLLGAPGGTGTIDPPPPPEPAGPPVVVATGIAAHGDDVVIVGTSNVSFAGEYGTGPYFFMWFGAFLTPACDGGTVYAGSIARGTVPFTP